MLIKITDKKKKQPRNTIQRPQQEAKEHIDKFQVEFQLAWTRQMSHATQLAVFDFFPKLKNYQM